MQAEDQLEQFTGLATKLPDPQESGSPSASAPNSSQVQIPDGKTISSILAQQEGELLLPSHSLQPRVWRASARFQAGHPTSSTSGCRSAGAIQERATSPALPQRDTPAPPPDWTGSGAERLEQLRPRQPGPGGAEPRRPGTATWVPPVACTGNSQKTSVEQGGPKQAHDFHHGTPAKWSKAPPCPLCCLQLRLQPRRRSPGRSHTPSAWWGPPRACVVPLRQAGKRISVTADEDTPACHEPCCNGRLNALQKQPRAARRFVKMQAVLLLPLHHLPAANSPSRL